MGVASQGAPDERTQNSVVSQFYSPPSEFDGCFTTFYHLTLDVIDGETIRDHLLPEWGTIRFFAGGTPSGRLGKSSINGTRFSATGPSSLPAEFELGSAQMWGIGFLPLGWARFIGTPAREMTNIVCDGARHPAFAKFDALSPVLCDPEISVGEQRNVIVDMLGQMMQPNRDEPKIVKIHEALVEGSFTSVGELAASCAMSIRTLERICSRYFGFTPKLLMRRQRFMRSLASWMLHQDALWTEAMDGEYHDQAQFTREFREFMTMNPSDYAALDHPIMSSFMEARARVWGSAAQTLDRPSR